LIVDHDEALAWAEPRAILLRIECIRRVQQRLSGRRGDKHLLHVSGGMNAGLGAARMAP
jgi:hypothetical protein